MGAERGEPLLDHRILIGIERIDEWGDHEPGPERAHLVHVEDGLGVLAVMEIDVQPGLSLRQHEPVAIVVVPHIRVIQPWQLDALIFGPDPPLVPIGNHLDAVRIVTGHQQRDRVVEDMLRFGSIGRDKLVGQRHGHQRRADLVRVLGCEHDAGRSRLAEDQGGLFIGQSPRIPEPAKQLAIALASGWLQIFGR